MSLPLLGLEVIPNPSVAGAQIDDQVYVNGVKSPGVCFLTGFNRNQGFDVKTGKGTEGATITMVKKPPIEGDIKFLIWTQDQFEAWTVFRTLLKYDPTKKSVTPISVYHNSLTDIDAFQFVCGDIGAYEIEGEPGQGLYSITIHLIEYFPVPKKASIGTPTGAPPNVAKNQTQPANQKLQDQIGSLLNEAAQP